MKISKVFLAAVSTLALWSMGSSQAPAEVIYDGAGFMRGTQSFSDSFNLSSAGTLTVTLTNVAWPQSLASLQLIVESTSGVLKSGDATTSPFTSSFSVNAGDVFAQWFGTAQGALDRGVYAINISFEPTGGNPVPLPTSIALFLSGIGLLVWQRRIRPDIPAETNGDVHDMHAA